MSVTNCPALELRLADWVISQVRHEMKEGSAKHSALAHYIANYTLSPAAWAYVAHKLTSN